MTTTVTYSIPNISCHHCIHTITTELTDLDGVISVEADLASKRTTISFEPPATEERIKSLLAEISYPPVENS